MAQRWTQERIEQEYIQAKVEESTSLEYTAAAALARTEGKKKEVTKDVSAFANAAGGLILYGVREYASRDKRHLPEKLDPVDRTELPREWLEHVIGNIRPRVEELVIHPVPIDNNTRPNNVVYAVEIPKSTTAHQAADFRYYRRYNFQCLPMLDHEIRDVMNRRAGPDAEVEFSEEQLSADRGEHWYQLRVRIANRGMLVIHHLKLEFAFPDLDVVCLAVVMDWSTAGNSGESRTERRSGRGLVEVQVSDPALSLKREHGWVHVSYRSKDVLFPRDTRGVDEGVSLRYCINGRVFQSRHRIPALNWTLYADSMARKQGEIPFSKLCRQY